MKNWRQIVKQSSLEEYFRLSPQFVCVIPGGISNKKETARIRNLGAK